MPAAVVTRQETVALTRGVVYTLPANPGRKGLTFQTFDGSTPIFLALGQDPAPNEDGAFIIRRPFGWHNLESPDAVDDGYVGDIRFLYNGVNPTAKIRIMEWGKA